MQEVHIVCGVPASGKTFVCTQLTDRFHYVAHDAHKQDLAAVLIRAARVCTRPILTECPFAERVLREELEAAGVTVRPYFIIESPDVVKKRYLERTKKPAPQNVVTRATTIRERAVEWKAPMGTSAEILNLLKSRAP